MPQDAAGLSADSKSSFMERRYDDTPLHLDFGSLGEVLAPAARYVIPAQVRKLLRADDDRVLVSYKHLLEYGERPGRRGIVDVFVQTLMVVTDTGFGSELLVPTRILRGRSAAFAHVALESVPSDAWGLTGITEMAKSQEVIFDLDVADSASYYRKKMTFFGSLLLQNNLFVLQRCFAHQTFRCTIKIMKKQDVLNKLSWCNEYCSRVL
jgi:hypothetical protein